MKKLFVTILSIINACAMLNLNIYASDTTINPPQLYSQAAILMDADTGQVLWDKNMNDRMYPASLTKVVTCLLAMELGNPEDVVTMTDEAVFSVPRSTTHIALTTGEQLTLEQLTYAMMVESANDAANGVAIHLGGSIEEFADMMNNKAVEIGATGSHFLNANGLPEKDHYTTAYDLGLFTKEALKYPEFRSLAGSQRYVIEPTNKQPQTRYLNNRQYMFCLNDTYPGAFAGKTGWTQEAGKTLITIAERDGITLICVVLKASGTIDAEFKDSTNLLDYGFDNFIRLNYPKENISDEDLKLDFNDGKEIKFKLPSELPVLLPEGVGIDELEVSLNAKKLILSVPQHAQDIMNKTVGSYELQEEAEDLELTAAVTNTIKEKREKKELEWVKILKWMGIGILCLIVLLFIIRQVAIARYRRRRKLRAYRAQKRYNLRNRY